MAIPLISTASPQFLASVEDWFRSRLEILVVIRYSYAAGNRDIQFFTSFETFRKRLGELPAKTSITLLRDWQLPLRGIVDDAFIEICMATIADGTEYVVAETSHRTAGKRSWLHNDSGTSLLELRDSLEESRGVHVCVGEYPTWFTDTEAILTAYIPEQDGAIKPGAY